MGQRVRVRNSERGFSIVEVIVAAGMLLLIASTLAFFVNSSKVTAASLRDTTTCNARANSVVEAIKSHDNKLYVNNWHSCSNAVTPGTTCAPGDGTPSTTSSPLPHSERFTPPTSPQIVSPDAGGNVTFATTNTYLLIDNAANMALKILNDHPNACSDTGPGIQFSTTGPSSTLNSMIATNPAWDISPVGTPLNNELDFLNLHLFDTKTNRSLPCGTTRMSAGYTGPQRIIPLGLKNSAASEVNLGIQVTVTVQYVDENNIQRACSATNRVAPEADLAAPKFVINPNSTTCNAQKYFAITGTVPPANWDPTCGTAPCGCPNFTAQPFFAAGSSGYGGGFNVFDYAFDCTWNDHFLCFGTRSPWIGPLGAYQVPMATYPVWEMQSSATVPTPNEPPKIYCGYPNAAPNVHVQVAANEPGVVFLCSFNSTDTAPPGNDYAALRSISATHKQNAWFTSSLFSPVAQPAAPANPFQPCASGRFTGPDGSTFTTTITQVTNPASDTELNRSTAVEINVDNLPEGFYTMFVEAVDSAQNVSAPMAESFAMDLTRPDTLVFQPRADGYMQVQVGNSNGRPNYAGAGARFYWDGVPVNPLVPDQATATSKAMCVSAALLPPQSPARFPATWAAGTQVPGSTHVVTAKPCDLCEESAGTNAAAPTFTYNFTLPSTPIPSPSPCVLHRNSPPCTSGTYAVQSTNLDAFYFGNRDTDGGLDTAVPIYGTRQSPAMSIAPPGCPNNYGEDVVLYYSCPVLFFPDTWCNGTNSLCSSGSCVNNLCTTDGSGNPQW